MLGITFLGFGGLIWFIGSLKGCVFISTYYICLFVYFYIFFYYTFSINSFTWGCVCVAFFVQETYRGALALEKTLGFYLYFSTGRFYLRIVLFILFFYVDFSEDPISLVSDVRLLVEGRPFEVNKWLTFLSLFNYLKAYYCESKIYIASFLLFYIDLL